MSRSLWSATAPLEPRPPLRADTEADVCIVGAGIAGLSVAWHLLVDGRSVVVLDDAEESETAQTTAHLVTALDRGWTTLVWVHGESLARLAAQSHAAAIERIEEIVQAERIACDFRWLDGWLVLAPDQHRERLVEERDAAHRAGLTGVELVDAAPAPVAGPGPALRYPKQAQIHPLRYLGGLRNAVERLGGRVHGSTHVVGLEAGRFGEVVTASGRVVRARHTVIATNSPIGGIVTLHTKQAAYRSYVVGVRAPRGLVPPGLYWDTADPFHYVRVQEDGADDVVVVGGEDHKTGQGTTDPRARWSALEAWIRRQVDGLGRVEHCWSGQVMESMDGLGFIGPVGGRPDAWMVTGDSGNGMTHGTIAGMLLADLIAGREHPWAAVYDPARVRVRAVGEFARENLNVAMRYAAWVAPGAAAPSGAERGRGRVVRRGLGKVAVYRDTAGATVERSAVCPHLGCIVAWNAAEGTWDCPCHGSRFDTRGRVMHGPATQDLDRVPGDTDAADADPGAAPS